MFQQKKLSLVAILAHTGYPEKSITSLLCDELSSQKFVPVLL